MSARAFVALAYVMVLDATAGDDEPHPVVALVEGTHPLTAEPTRERPRGQSRRAELAALAGIGGQVVEG